MLGWNKINEKNFIKNNSVQDSNLYMRYTCYLLGHPAATVNRASTIIWLVELYVLLINAVPVTWS